MVCARVDGHDDLFHGGVARAGAQSVHSALYLTYAGFHGCKRVCHREAQVVVAVHRPDDGFWRFDASHKRCEEAGEFVWLRITDRIRHVDRGGAIGDGGLEDLDKKFRVGAARVLGRELHVIDVALGKPDGACDCFKHLFLGHFEPVLHVDGAGGDIDVYARSGRVFDRVGRLLHVLF